MMSWVVPSLALLYLFYSVALAKDASLVLLKQAASQGAVCLDGSPPGYYIRPGSGEGQAKWIVYLEGGGSCQDLSDCYQRSKTDLGSSKNWHSSVQLTGFLSDSETVNPDFYNWNIVLVMYCDGGVYSGNVLNTVYYDNHPLYFRGWRVLQENFEALLSAGMKNASDIIMSGGSAGGAATYGHVDQVADMLPQGAKFRALPDAGYFIDAPNTEGKYVFREKALAAGQMQNATGTVNADCLKHYGTAEAWKCGFVPYMFPFIRTPLFMLNSQYDTWQIANILQLGCIPPFCSHKHMEELENYRQEWLTQAKPPFDSSSTGVFADSCLIHTQVDSDKHWTRTTIGGQTMRETFADWYFDRAGDTKEVDCTYPCNPTCSTFVYHNPAYDLN